MDAPKPVHTRTVCSVCGLEWKAHRRKTVDECVRLLKAELTKRPKQLSYLQTGYAGNSATGTAIVTTGGK